MWNGPLDIPVPFFQGLVTGFFDRDNNLIRKNGHIVFRFSSRRWLNIRDKTGLTTIVDYVFLGNEEKAKEVLVNLLSERQLEELIWSESLGSVVASRNQELSMEDRAFKAIADLAAEVRPAIADLAAERKITQREIRRSNQRSGSMSEAIGVMVENLIRGGLFDALRAINMNQSIHNGRHPTPITFENPSIPVQFESKRGPIYRSKEFDIFVVVRQKNEIGEIIVKILIIETKTSLKKEHLVALNRILMNRTNVTNIINYVMESIQDSDLPFGLMDNDPLYSFDFDSNQHRIFVFAAGAYLKEIGDRVETEAQKSNIYLMRGIQSANVEVQNPEITPKNFYTPSD